MITAVKTQRLLDCRDIPYFKKPYCVLVTDSVLSVGDSFDDNDLDCDIVFRAADENEDGIIYELVKEDGSSIGSGGVVHVVDADRSIVYSQSSCLLKLQFSQPSSELYSDWYRLLLEFQFNDGELPETLEVRYGGVSDELSIVSCTSSACVDLPSNVTDYLELYAEDTLVWKSPNEVTFPGCGELVRIGFSAFMGQLANGF